MKTTRSTLLILFVLCFSLSSFASDQLKLKLEEGQKIEFQYVKTIKPDLPKRLLQRISNSEEKWIVEFEVQEVAKKHLKLAARVKRYISTDYGTNKPMTHFDSNFSLNRGQSEHLFLNLTYDVLTRLTVLLDVNLDKHDVSVASEEKYEQDIAALLDSKDLGSEKLHQAKKIIPDLGTYFLCTIIKDYLLRIDYDLIHPDAGTQFSSNYYTLKTIGQSLKLSKIVPIQKTTGKQHYWFDASVNLANGMILESTAKTFVPDDKKYDRYQKPRTEVESFLLLKNSKTYRDQVTISGFIENPKRKSLQFHVLNAPAGEKLATFRTRLNTHNRFSITFPMSRANMIFVSNSYDESLPIAPFIQALYAEPGDSINMELWGGLTYPGDSIKRSNDSKDPKRSGIFKQYITHFSGDRVAENNYLSTNFQRQLHIGGDISQLTFPLFATRPPFSPEEQIERYQKIILSKALKPSDFLESVSPKFKSFFMHETEMQKFSLASNLLMFSGLVRNTAFENLEEVIKRDVDIFFERFDFTHNYEEYGYFSRKAIASYVQYQFFDIYKFTDPVVSLEQFPKNEHPKYDVSHFDQQVSLLNLILAGSALAREKVDLIYHLVYESSRLSEFGRKKLFDAEKQFLNEMIQSSRDTSLNNYSRKLLATADDIFSGKNYDKKLFLTPAGDTVALSNYIGKKACVISFSDTWSENCYLFDEVSRKYPDVNAVVVNEGSDFEVWKDYIDRAKPKAVQLFFPNEKHSLKELFLVHSGAINIFDRHGDLQKYRVDPNQLEMYIQRILKPSKQKSELNKSTLYGIIWFMGGFMLLGLIAFLIFKARVRLKMRKEKREKRLQELQLSAIRAQMNPHFLFNSLNSVQNLIQKNQGREAHLYLSDFASLIRKVLKNSQAEEVSLAEEMETLNQYIRLEQLRFDFGYQQTIDEGIDQNHFMVPSLILQPVAENAIVHGLQHKPDNRKLILEIKKMDNAIQISIEDNGIGLESSKEIKSVSNGIGLNMNEERLRIMQEKYGGNYSFKLIDLTQQGREGTRVEITIPEEE